MSIRLITGIPGSGKTLFAISELKRELEKNQASDNPRSIYCDITGLKVVGINPPPIDWRQTPPNSLLIYDEAQFHQEFKPHRGISQYKQVEELTIHRKTGHDIWFITQDPKRLHNDILAMVEQHYHLERPYGAKLASIYQYRGVEKNPTGITVKQRAENKRLFAYDKSLYELYESSQVKDGIKFRLPRELAFWCLVLLGVLFGTYYLIFNKNTQRYITAVQNGREGEIDSGQVVGGQVPIPSTEQTVGQVGEKVEPKPVQQDKALRGVIKLGNKCSAYDKDGMVIELSKKDCEYYLAKSGRVAKGEAILPKPQEPPPNEPIQPVSHSNANPSYL